VLKLVEWRWHLDPLTVRDANANNLANALNFAQPNLSAPRFAIDPGPYGGACPIAAPQTEAELPPEQLLDVAKSLGFPVPS
jgi:phospholipase C